MTKRITREILISETRRLSYLSHELGVLDKEYFLNRIMQVPSNDFRRNSVMGTLTIRYFSVIESLVDLCVEQFPERKGDVEFEQNCALVYFNAAILEIVYNHKDESLEYDLAEIIGTFERISEYFLYAVVALNLFEVTFKQRTVIALTVLVNFMTGFPKAF
jgi:hypothetical protein